MIRRMTAPRALVAGAVLLGLLSTSLAKAIRVEELHGRPAIASKLSHEPARQSAERLALMDPTRPLPLQGGQGALKGA